MNLSHKPMSKAFAKDQRTLAQAVLNHFRCPDEFLDFRLSKELSPEPGYFQFGHGTTCFGRSLNGALQAQVKYPLSDVLPNVFVDGKQLVLPFDPDEIIDNLRLERYTDVQLRRHVYALKKIYYWLRPFTNRAIRRLVQKLRANNWQKRQFPHWPVDTTVESICENLLMLSLRASGADRIPFIWFWPDGARGCVTMTHDVETVAGRDFCTQLMDIDDSYGIKASFQIVPEERYPVTPEFLDRLRDRGFEVCVQDLNHDGRLFDERKEFLRRVTLINRYGHEYGARGYRSAGLYRKAEWYGDFDFSFDMSFGNVVPLDPQRGGCCTVMPYFIGDILELPVTTTQDYTLFHVLNDHSIELWKQQIELILAKNGLASFIVHPDYITEDKEQAVYRDLLTMLAELRKREALWFALPSEIDSWWRARSRMSIVKENGSWRITGEGAERAVLAFARIADGKLIYEQAYPQQKGNSRVLSILRLEPIAAGL